MGFLSEIGGALGGVGHALGDVLTLGGIAGKGPEMMGGLMGDIGKGLGIAGQNVGDDSFIKTGDEKMPAPTAAPAITPKDVLAAQTSNPVDTQRHGLFGLKGDARDIIGLIGDWALMNGGADPMFAPRRLQEQENDRYGQITQNFTDDPMGTIRAMHQAGYGKEAQALLKQHQENAINSAKAGAEIGTQAATQREKNVKTDQSVDERVGNVMSLMNADNYSQLKPVVETMWERSGIKNRKLPDQFNQTDIKAIMGQGMDLKDTMANDLGRDKARADVIIRGGQLKLNAYDKVTDNMQNATNEGGRNARNATNETGRNTRATTAEQGRNARYDQGKRYDAKGQPWKSGAGSAYVYGYNANGQYGLIRVK